MLTDSDSGAALFACCADETDGSVSLRVRAPQRFANPRIYQVQVDLLARADRAIRGSQLRGMKPAKDSIDARMSLNATSQNALSA